MNFGKEFENAKDSSNKLKKLHEKISNLRFLDPACGCGNFLIIAYRELRLLEMEIIKLLLKNQILTNIDHYFLLDVDRFYGIEYEEFPAQIAQVAMWLIDHQMNMKASETFGEYYVRLPLKKSAVIKHGNALRIDWQSLIEPLPWEKGEQKFDYIFGNPPFVGKSLQNAEQKKDMEMIFAGMKGAGVMDYVSAWYIKAAKYLEEYNKSFTTKCAFVSTNSISQGEQVGILWNELFNHYKIKIHFAHRTFKWGNEARGNAGVYVVIIGFTNFDINEKTIFEYENVKGEPHAIKVNNVNPYLIAGKDLIVLKRRVPISNIPEISFGSMPNDGGGLLMSNSEKIKLINNDSKAQKFVRPLLSAHEFIHGDYRWCLWLKNASPSEIKESPLIIERISIVKNHRSKSTRDATIKLAAYPTLFGEDRQPSTQYILVPLHSSENRKYIPLGFFQPYKAAAVGPFRTLILSILSVGISRKVIFP